MRVSQALCGAGPVDAVTNQGLAFRRLFSGWGWEGGDYAAIIDPALRGSALRPLRDMEPGADDVLLVHYSGHAPGLEELVEASRHSMLISHNVTPAEYFWEDEPLEAVRCTLGPPQLHELAGLVDIAAGVSRYNALALNGAARRPAEVIPVLFERGSLGRPGPKPSGPPTFLFVGRLAPHKRQDLLIRAFASYRRRAPDARLVLVGVPISPSFKVRLRALAEELAPGAVTIESAISASELRDHYRAADAFVCLSEHEGFCIPLLESFHFGVPVIARRAGAVDEVVGDAGILLGDEDDAETVAELLSIVAGDDELRRALRVRGERRLEKYAFEQTSALLKAQLTSLAAA